MKRITALLHRHRMSDIVHVLENAGVRRISVMNALGLLSASGRKEVNFSVDLGDRITQESQLEIFCEDDELSSVVAMLQHHGQANSVISGWIFVSDIAQAIAIDGTASAR